MIRLFLASLVLLASTVVAQAETISIQPVLQDYSKVILKSSRKTIAPAIDAVATSNLPQAQNVLEAWQTKNMWHRKSDGLFYLGSKKDSKTYQLISFDDGSIIGDFPKSELKQIKPNSGIRALIGNALVQFQLSDPDPENRMKALQAIERSPTFESLAPLKASIDTETDPILKSRKTQLVHLLTISFAKEDAERVDAISAVSSDLSVEVRATLNRVLETQFIATKILPKDKNIAMVLVPGSSELTIEQAYSSLVSKNLAPSLIDAETIRETLAQNIKNGRVGGVPTAQLDTYENRAKAYAALVSEGKASAIVDEKDIVQILHSYKFAQVYKEPSSAVTTAARAALDNMDLRLKTSQTIDLGLDALSLASIYFLAAIGLAITFGVMGVINMAHGEFIMMGAYTGFVVQQFIPDHTVSLIVALPLAFLITFVAGVLMERLVIRWLYHRPLETLLATFGISIALQQLAKNIFGTQARPLTAPSWLDGAWIINDAIQISYIRIAIFIMALCFLCLLLFILKRTRLGLEVRAVTQNPRMAASMGINPERINMLTFGLGSGIAGIAGVAIGLYAKVTSEMGADYIVQSFMTVVVGGVGNVWGTLAGAGMIGSLQKGIEWLNPSNTLAAQTYMILFIILFIQFRPKGIVALKGRAAGD